MLLVFLLVTSGFTCTLCTGCPRFVVSSKEEKPLMLVEKDAPVCPSVGCGSSALCKNLCLT